MREVDSCGKQTSDVVAVFQKLEEKESISIRLKYGKETLTQVHCLTGFTMIWEQSIHSHSRPTM